MNWQGLCGHDYLQTWPSYCAFLTSGVCVAAPPPPISCFEPPVFNSPGVRPKDLAFSLVNSLFLNRPNLPHFIKFLSYLIWLISLFLISLTMKPSIQRKKQEALPSQAVKTSRTGLRQEIVLPVEQGGAFKLSTCFWSCFRMKFVGSGILILQERCNAQFNLNLWN